MGSSVNLSSLLSAFNSSASGINVQAAVAQAIAAESGPLTQMQNEQAVVQSRTSDINIIVGDATALQNSLSALTDPLGAMSAMTAASSDSGIVNASAAAGALAGNHVVQVNSLATTASWYSSSVASSSTPLSAGSFTIQVGTGGPATQIQIGGSVDTLDQLASYINGLSLGVTANVVNDSSGSRLSIVSNSSGAANNFTITQASGLTFTQAATGTDASLTVDGIPIDSASNTITGAVAGLTLNLTGAAPNTPVSISVAPDGTQIDSAVSAFVTAYNKVISDINQEYTVGANGVEGPLSGDGVLPVLQSDMLSAGSYAGGTGGITTMADLGITMNNDGTLSLNTSTLDAAVQSNFAGVQNFLAGTASNGFVSFMNNQLTSLTDPASGAFTVDLQSLSSENTDLQNQITNFQSYLSNQTTLLTNEFNQADVLLAQLPTEEAQINAELGYSPNSSSGTGVA